MIESMTGFGRGDAHIDGYSIETEIRTVNNRYCDVFIKMPSEHQHFESELRVLIQNRIERGKANATIRIDHTGAAANGLKINQNLASGYYRLLEELSNKVGLNEKPGLDHLIRFEEIFRHDAMSEEMEAAFKQALFQSVNTAIDNTLKMRRQEGIELSRDIMERIDGIEGVITQIRALSVDRIPEARQKLHERVQALVTDEAYDRDRLELEIALIADKLDITEELVRLDAHLKFFRETLEDEKAAGRRLNFLLQEILREVNTIGSKAYNAQIAHKVVEVKESIEIIREQVQNIV